MITVDMMGSSNTNAAVTAGFLLIGPEVPVTHGGKVFLASEAKSIVIAVSDRDGTESAASADTHR